ncbi:MAG TPA: hypothetical protein VFX16_25960 [Pseudonocardiaceae bacterium]|nr:hypothetical protein [Pseudonocardiaceae bacterium]
MSDPKRALILHMTGIREPLLISIPDEKEDEFVAGLPDLIRKGQVETIAARNGSSITVNFGHVVAAHVDTLPGIGQIYGRPAPGR